MSWFAWQTKPTQPKEPLPSFTTSVSWPEIVSTDPEI